MTGLLATLGLLGLALGYGLDAPDDQVLGAICLVMAALAWLVNSLYMSWLRNHNASYTLAESERRRRIGGAL